MKGIQGGSRGLRRLLGVRLTRVPAGRRRSRWCSGRISGRRVQLIRRTSWARRACVVGAPPARRRLPRPRQEGLPRQRPRGSRASRPSRSHRPHRCGCCRSDARPAAAPARPPRPARSRWRRGRHDVRRGDLRGGVCRALGPDRGSSGRRGVVAVPAAGGRPGRRARPLPAGARDGDRGGACPHRDRSRPDVGPRSPLAGARHPGRRAHDRAASPPPLPRRGPRVDRRASCATSPCSRVSGETGSSPGARPRTEHPPTGRGRVRRQPPPFGRAQRARRRDPPSRCSC